MTNELQESRSTYVQKCSGLILLEILANYPRDFLLSISNVLKPFVLHCVKNPNGECRAYGRKALMIWQQIDPGSSERVFH